VVSDVVSNGIGYSFTLRLLIATSISPNVGSLSRISSPPALPWWRRREAQGSRITLAPNARDELRGARGAYREERGILLYSDGLVEAHDSKGEMFGFPRLRALIAEHGENRLLGDLLLDELNSFVAEGWEEDVTLLTLEHFPIRS
jgi:hypothetical protein